MSVMTDTYKATHLLMYPKAKEMRAYGEFRKAYPGMDNDRIVVCGIRYYIDNFISQAIPQNDIESARAFLEKHILLSEEVQNRGYFKPYDSATAKSDTTQGKMLKEQNYLDLLVQNNYKFPVKIEAMPEGSVIRPHIPAFIITAKGEYSRLCTFLETMLTMIWYPSCVATLSRYTRDLIEKAFRISVDDDDPNREKCLNSRLHDFGFRGCTSVEQSVIGGCAHLLSFNGSDTMSACYYAQTVLNGGKPVGFSIPATEHSVMTSWKSEMDAVMNLCEKFPGRFVSSVMDAYDYDRMLNVGLPMLKSTVEDKKCILIVRPDSGDPIEQVIKALDAAYIAHYRHSTNKKGFITFEYFAVLQGDGINYAKVREILNAVLDKGYAASNVAFGMGGGLLQKVDRDTMSFATKLCYMMDENGADVDVVKDPAGQEGKLSLGGKMTVLHEHTNGQITGEHFLCTETAAEAYMLQQPGKFAKSMTVVYDGTDSATTSAPEIEKFNKELFDETKARLKKEWELFSPPRPALDTSIVLSQLNTREKIRERQEKAFAEVKKKHYESNTSGPRPRTGAANLVSKADFHPNSHHAIQLNSSLKESSQAILHALEKLL